MVTDDRYYSEREGRERARDQDAIGDAFWGGFVALVGRLCTRGYFAESFPKHCPDGPFLVAPGDEQALALTFRAEITEVSWPLDPAAVPATLDALDAVDFFARHVSTPGGYQYHSFFGHDHVHSFDRAAGLVEFRAEVNRLLRRCGHPYELTPQGGIQRLGPPILREALPDALFHTGEAGLDSLLSNARDKFLHPDPAVRAEALEKLWDAWERLKTLLLPDNKAASIKLLLEQAVPEPSLRAELDAEACALTNIGNEFMIRHTEVGKPKIEPPEQVDYLFHRMFALIYLLLKATGRASA